MSVKCILISGILLTFSFLVQAQKSFEPSTYIGINGGVNFSSVNFTPSPPQDILLSNSIGIVMRHVSERSIGFQMELNYSGKGWKEAADTMGTYTRKLNTIDVPVTAVFIIGSRLLQVTIAIGPYGSYIFKEKESINIATDRYEPYYGIKLESKWEFGFTGGLGIEFHTPAGVFVLRGTYSHALTNLFPLNSDDYYFSASRNQVIHAGIMYMIRF